MPRPNRYAEREAGPAPKEGEGGQDDAATRTGKVAGDAAGDGGADGAATETRRGRVRHVTERLDDGQDSSQSSRSDPSREAEMEVARRVASRLGWTPREEWSRDPAKWVDAEAFLERTTSEVEKLKERAKRTGRMTDQAQAESRQRLAEEANREVRAAVAAGDEEGAVRASQKLAASQAPDPRTVAWVGRNEWFDSDPEAKDFAVAVVKRCAAQGMSHEEQLEEAESAVRKRFPEHFGGGREREEPVVNDSRQQQRQDPPSRDTGRETRLSDRRTPPQVTGGSRTLGGPRGAADKVVGWKDIPADDRAQQTVFVKNFMRRGMTQDQAQERLAKGYWDNKGTQVSRDD